jgi:DNA-directed RNA polymerase subunit RPC12/RpoP
MYKCVNCNHESEAVSVSPLPDKCIICGDEVVVIGKKKEQAKKEDLDLNNDGKVDKKDARIASKVMNAVRKRKKSKR